VGCGQPGARHRRVRDWNGDGTWTRGLLREGPRWYLKDSFTGCIAGIGLAKQAPGTPVAGLGGPALTSGRAG
jgi:hypothetical protein